MKHQFKYEGKVLYIQFQDKHHAPTEPEKIKIKNEKNYEMSTKAIASNIIALFWTQKNFTYKFFNLKSLKHVIRKSDLYQIEECQIFQA